MRGYNTDIIRIKEKFCTFWERINLFWLLYRKAILAVTFVFSLVLIPLHQAYAFPPLLLLLGGGIGAAGIAAYLSDVVFNKLFQILAGLLLWIAELAAGLMTIAGLILDVSIDYTIAQNPLKNLPAIELSWAVLRDIANMFFIFILLAIAIATILGIERYGAKQLLAKLIIVALLINFSLFFTKVVFDVSNLLAVGFYKELTIDSANVARITGVVPKPSSGTITTGNKGSISFTIFNSLLLQDAFKTDSIRTLIEQRANNQADANGRIAAFSIVMALLFLVMAWIFFKLALVFAVRIGLFIFLMILSPLAFLAAILPGTQEYFKKWIHILLAQAFVAPLALLFLFTTIILIQGGVAGNTGFVINAITKPDLDVRDLLKFLIIAILLVLSYRVTTMVSGQFATAIVNGFTGRMFRFGRNVALAPALLAGGAVLRATLARGAFHADKALKKTKFFGGTRVGGALLKGTTGVVANEKFGTNKSFREIADQLGKEKRERSAALKDVRGRKGSDRLIANNYQGSDDEKTAARNEDIGIVGKMNLRQLEALGAKRLVALSSGNHLSVEKLESIQKSEKLSEGQIGEIITARFNKTNAALKAFKKDPKNSSVRSDLQKEVRQLSDKELALWGERALGDSDIIEALSQKQITDLKKLPKLSSGLKGHITETRNNTLEKILSHGNEMMIKRALGDFTPGNFADIKDDFYKKYSDTLTKYTAPSVLIEIGKKKNIGVRDAIRQSIKDANTRGTANQAQIKAQEWFDKPQTPSGMIF